MKKICLFFFCLLSATLAHAGSCGSISDLEKSKAKLFKNFEKCNAISVVSVHSVSVAGFSVYEKASVDEEKKLRRKRALMTGSLKVRKLKSVSKMWTRPIRFIRQMRT